MSLLETFRNILDELGCVSGCVHSRQGERLHLEVQVGLPASVLTLIASIPKGKGMAGQAWLRSEPTMTCNLKTDQTAPIEPGAREVDASSAIAIPVMDQDGEVVAVVGFAFGDDTGFDSSRLARCQAAALRTIQAA